MDFNLFLTDPNYATNMVADIADHAASGYFVAKAFFPEGGKVKTAVRSAFAGFLPDIDYIIPGMSHRDITHGWFAPALPVGYSLFEKARSKAFAMAGIGTAAHLFVDSFTSLEERVTYLGVMVVALGLQKWNELRNNSFSL